MEELWQGQMDLALRRTHVLRVTGDHEAADDIEVRLLRAQSAVAVAEYRSATALLNFHEHTRLPRALFADRSGNRGSGSSRHRHYRCSRERVLSRAHRYRSRSPIRSDSFCDGRRGRERVRSRTRSIGRDFLVVTTMIDVGVDVYHLVTIDRHLLPALMMFATIETAVTVAVSHPEIIVTHQDQDLRAEGKINSESTPFHLTIVEMQHLTIAPRELRDSNFGMMLLHPRIKVKEKEKKRKLLPALRTQYDAKREGLAGRR